MTIEFPFALYWFYFFLYAFFTAAGLQMWDYCMTSSGRLLTFYKVWLLERCLQKFQGKGAELRLWQSIKLPEVTGENSKGLEKRIYAAYVAKLEQHAGQYIFWEKPLGLCTICFSPYMATAVFFLSGLQSHFDGSLWSYSLPLWFAMLTSFLFRKISA